MARNNETTTKFKVDISELKKSMQDARKQVALANSEFKAASSSMDNWAKSTDGISAKLKQLNSNVDSQKKVLAQYESTLEEVKAQYGENSAAAQEYQTKLNNQQAVVNRLESEIKRYTSELDRAEKAEDLAASTGREAADVFDELSDAADGAAGSTEKLTGGFTVMKGALATLVADGIKNAIGAIKDFAKESIQVGIDFEAAMSEVGAISGATGEDLKLLEETARKYGETSVFSASEAAQALKYMALAGWDAQTSTGALGGVLDLAAASGMDLAKASDMVTDYMSAFGMEASKSGYFADLLAYAQSNANTSAEQLGEAFKNCAANLNAGGQDVETTSALLSMMANQGFKGAEAGTALTAIMRDMTAKMEKGKIAIGNTSVTVQDANGNYRDLTDILTDVEKAVDGMGDAQRATALSTTFTADSTKGLNLLLNAGVGEAAKFESALRDAGGTAKDMGETMNDNAAGDIKALESALEGVKIEVYKELQPTIREFVKYLTKDGVSTLKDISKYFIELAKKAMPYVKKAFEVLAKVVKFAAENLGALVGVIGTAITVFKLLKAAMAISTAITTFRTAVATSTVAVNAITKAQYAWNAAMSANVIGLVVTAIGLLVGGIYALCTAEEKATAQQDLLNEKQRNAVSKAQDAANSYKELKDEAEKVAGAESANIEYTKQLWGELQKLTDENGKVKAGYEGRVEFILGQLNEALGTEYSMNDGIIQQYGDMKQSIDSVIEAKKAQLLLAAYEDSYKEAILNVKAAEESRGLQAQELAQQRAIVAQKEKEAEEALAAFREKSGYAFNEYNTREWQALAKKADEAEKALEREKKTLDTKQKEYNKMDNTLKTYYADISNYEAASTAAIEGNNARAVKILNGYGDGLKTVASTAKLSADEQKKVLEQQVIDTEVQLGLMQADFEETQKNGTAAQIREAKKRLDNAKEQAEAAKSEFYNVGGNIVKGMASGAETYSYVLSDAMAKIVSDALAAAKKKAKIKSPSRLFRDEVGKFIGLGVAAGIDNSTKDVIGSAKDQITSIKNAYGSAVSAISPAATTAVTGGASAGVVNNFYQTNNSPEPLSRLEIYRQTKNLLGYAGGV